MKCQRKWQNLHQRRCWKYLCVEFKEGWNWISISFDDSYGGCWRAVAWWRRKYRIPRLISRVDWGWACGGWRWSHKGEDLEVDWHGNFDATWKWRCIGGYPIVNNKIGGDETTSGREEQDWLCAILRGMILTGRYFCTSRRIFLPEVDFSDLPDQRLEDNHEGC